MFFALGLRTKHRWLQQVIYWSQVPVVAGVGFGAARLLFVLLRRGVSALGSPWVTTGMGLISPVLLFLGAAALCIFLLEKLYRYRTGNLLVASLALCPEDVSSPEIQLRRGDLVVELHMGEFYDFAKYGRLKLKPAEFVPVAFLDTYKAVIDLIGQVRSGAAPLNGNTLLMTTTVFLSAAHQVSPIHFGAAVVRGKTLLHRLSLALGLRMNPFSSRIPAPRTGAQRVYLPVQTLVDHEQFFRDEVARLSKLTQKILNRKERRRARQRQR
jgi:hypothetical protein